jgi:hypothetical protein
MYNRPPVDIVDLFEPFPDEIKAIGEKLREIIIKTTPGIEKMSTGVIRLEMLSTQSME